MIGAWSLYFGPLLLVEGSVYIWIGDQAIRREQVVHLKRIVFIPRVDPGSSMPARLTESAAALLAAMTKRGSLPREWLLSD